MLDGDDAGGARRVVDLVSDSAGLDEFADRDQSGRSRDQRVVWLTRRALRLLLEADVEPDRRVEGRELIDEDRLQLVLERLCLVLAREVAAVAPPAADR